MIHSFLILVGFQLSPNERLSPEVPQVGSPSQHGMQIMTQMTQMIQNDRANIAV